MGVGLAGDGRELADHVAAALAGAPDLAGWLREQRWFGDKDRAIVSVATDGVAPLGGEPPAFWAAVEVAFGAGSARYALPLTLRPDSNAPSPLATVSQGALVDATSDPAVAARLLDLIATGARIPCGAGMLVFEPLAGLPALLDKARSGPIRGGGLEQSNTAIRYGVAMLLKLFRKLQPGINPDEEIGRFLARSGFRAVPEPLAAIRHVDGDGAGTLAGFGQAFVPNEGDGWTWLLSLLRAKAGADPVAPIAALGRATAELHVALASDPSDPAFAPEPADAGDIDDLQGAAETHLDETLAALRRRRESLDAPQQKVIDRALAAEPALRRTLAGFGAESGVARIRVHGDYHLGQTLRTSEGGWTIIDFEGEPARPIAERRRKTSALKDVAGMLRSFGYARGTLEREGPAGTADTDLAAWEQAGRTVFLTAYRREVANASTPLVPPDDAAFARALAAWELDKALYEVRYELANRPTWLPIPLATLAPSSTE